MAAQIDANNQGNPSLIADPGNVLWKVKFKHIPTGEKVAFTAWVTDFNDSFSSSWNEETAYGRMDPLVTFQNTRRNITMGIDVVAANQFEAINNTAKLDKLIRFLYPVYTESERAYSNTLKSAPLIEVEWANLISGPAGEGGSTGVIGYLQGLNYNPMFEHGMFISGADEDANLFPQNLKFQFDLKVLHTHLAGWHKVSGDEGDSYVFGGDDSKYPHRGDNPISNAAAQPCADGPWIPDSAINVSENQRDRRLMMEEVAANQEVLRGLGPPGTRARRIARLEQERNRGHNYNAGCENPPDQGPMGQRELRLRQQQNPGVWRPGGPNRPRRRTGAGAVGARSFLPGRRQQQINAGFDVTRPPRIGGGLQNPSRGILPEED